MNFRSAPGRFVEWKGTRIEDRFSNSGYVDEHFYSDPVLRRIFSLARKFEFQSLLLEIIDESDCDLLRQDNDALKLRRADFASSEVFRITFWRCAPGSASSPEDFIGYAVFKCDAFNASSRPACHVYESVMPLSRGAEQNTFVHCCRDYTVKTPAGLFTVRGVLYAQQNDLTTVCAHVALRSALACLLPEADVTYAEMNQFIGIDHQKVQIGDKKGLKPFQIEEIITGKKLEFQKLALEPDQVSKHTPNFQHELYGIIESGFPALLGFELERRSASEQDPGRHIIPVFGHTFNEDAWVPDAQRAYFAQNLHYFSSESWLSSFIVHDDNFGPSFCLPRHYLRQENFRILYGIKPKEAFVTATQVELVGVNYLVDIAQATKGRGHEWFGRFTIYADVGKLVVRAILVTRDQYSAYLESLQDWRGHQLESWARERLLKSLPERFWMVEASGPELFPFSRRKFGELLIDADSVSEEPAMFAARLPGYIMTYETGDLALKETSLTGHTALFDLSMFGRISV